MVFGAQAGAEVGGERLLVRRAAWIPRNQGMGMKTAIYTSLVVTKPHLTTPYVFEPPEPPLPSLRAAPVLPYALYPLLLGIGFLIGNAL
jgi:hypothetical protein